MYVYIAAFAVEICLVRWYQYYHHESSTYTYSLMYRELYIVSR